MAVSISGRFAPLSGTLTTVPLTVNASDGSSIPDRKGLATWWAQTGRDSTLAHATRGGIGEGATAPLAGAGVQWAGTASATTAGEAAGIDFICTRLRGAERFFAPFLAKTFQGAPPRFATAWAALDEFIDPPPEQRDDVLGQDLISRDEVERPRRHHHSLHEVVDTNAVLRFKDWGGQVRPLTAESPWLECLDRLEAEARSHQRMHDVFSLKTDDGFSRGTSTPITHSGSSVIPGHGASLGHKTLPIKPSFWQPQRGATSQQWNPTPMMKKTKAPQPLRGPGTSSWTPTGATRTIRASSPKPPKRPADSPSTRLEAGEHCRTVRPPDAMRQHDQGGVDRVLVANAPATSVRQLARQGVRGHENRDARPSARRDMKPTTTMPRGGCKHFWCVPGAICPDGPNSRTDADGKILGQYLR